MKDDNSLCPECFGDALEVVNVRDVQPPRRKGKSVDVVTTVVARKIEVRCRTCGWDGFVLVNQ